MKSNELQVFKDTEGLVLEIMHIYPQLPNVHKFTIGETVYKKSLSLLDYIIKANRHKDKRVEYLDSFLDCFEECQTLLRLMIKEKLISIKKEAHFALIFEKIGKQINGWRNVSGL